MRKISVVINTFDEEKNIKECISSVSWADEIVVCDMHSSDKTVSIARKLGAKVTSFKKIGYVEPARNFAISKTSGDWILVVDADEEIPQLLASELKSIAQADKVDFVRIARKNIIFNHWMRASQWWPDYNIRFFKKGQVTWGNEIHRPPKTDGNGMNLEDSEDLAILHHHYESVSQFIDRMNRYTTIQARQLKKSGYKFNWIDLIDKPVNEFLGRFFANKGFRDGLHGLSLSVLQAFSFFVMYLKVWDMEGFKEKEINLEEVKVQAEKSGLEIKYWFKYGNLPADKFKSLLQKIKNRFV